MTKKLSVSNLMKPGVRIARSNTKKNTNAIRIIGHEKLAIVTEIIEGKKTHKVCSETELEKIIKAQSNNIEFNDEQHEKVNKKSNKYRLLLELEMAEQGMWLQQNDKIAIRNNDKIDKYSFDEALSILEENVENANKLIKEYEHVEDKLVYVLAYKQKSDHRYFILSELIDFIYAKRNLINNDFENIINHKIMAMRKKARSPGMSEETSLGVDLCSNEIDDFRNMDDKPGINDFRYPKEERNDNKYFGKYIGNINIITDIRSEPVEFTDEKPPFSQLNLK